MSTSAPSPRRSSKRESTKRKKSSRAATTWRSRRSVYGERAADVGGTWFQPRSKEDRCLAPATSELRESLKETGRSVWEVRTFLTRSQADPEKLEQLEAVKRWFNEDWRRIEPKLRTSIVEGISVILSLFDDNPRVKRVFCPKRECLRPI